MRAGGCETWLCVYDVTKSVQTPTCANVSQTHMRMDTLWQKPRHQAARQRIRGRACESKRGCTARCTSCSNANSSVATPVNINSRLYITARPTLAPPPRSCMGCARVHARPRAAHACNRPHHDATRRRHSLHPARADLAHTHVPQEPQALGSAIVLLEVGSTRLDEAPAKRGTRSSARRGGPCHIHDDHLDVVTVAGDRTCPQPRAPSISSRRSLSRSHSLQVGARPTSRL